MLFFHFYKIIFFSPFSVFLFVIMYILNITRALKKMSVNEIRNFNFENYYKQIGFPKENCYYSKKRLKKNIYFCCNSLIEKINDPRNAKEHYQPFM